MVLKDKKKKIRAMLLRANEELKQYKKTQKFPNLSQACEKTWVAFTLLVEEKSKKELKSHSEIKKASKETDLKALFAHCRYLHIIHYEGSPGINFWDTVEDISDGIKEVKKELQRLPK